MTGPLWWHCRDEGSEHLWGPEPTREAAIQAGRIDYGGEQFCVCAGKRFQYRADIFDWEVLADQFEDRNEDYSPEDGAAANWTREQGVELERELEAVFDAWLVRHGHKGAWAIDTGPYEVIPAQGIEATTADETRSGSAEGESAVGEADAPETPPVASSPNGLTQHPESADASSGNGEQAK